MFRVFGRNAFKNNDFLYKLVGHLNRSYKKIMPREIYPSSYICDCGYRCEFSENTIKEIKAASMKRKQGLIADDGMHEVIFDRGGMIAIYCPQENTSKTRNRK